MARSTFFSFHYQRDVWRINQIRNIPNVTGNAAAGFRDASLWEEAKKKGDAVIKKMIDDALVGTSVTVVFIGNQTANRKYVNYEIEKSIDRGNGILGVRIHHLTDHAGKTDLPGATPAKLTAGGYPVYTFTNVNDLSDWIEKAAKAAGK
jgi:hypothetical protein